MAQSISHPPRHRAAGERRAHGTSPASLTSSQGLRGSKSHGRDASLGTMRPGQGVKGQLRTAAPLREAPHLRACGQGWAGNAVCSGVFGRHDFHLLRKHQKPSIPRRHTQQERPGWSRSGKRKKLREKQENIPTPAAGNGAAAASFCKGNKKKNSPFPSGRGAPGVGAALSPRVASCSARRRGTNPPLSAPAAG